MVEAVLAGKIVPDYKETERKSPQGGRRQFRVSLGTIPDYAAKVDGVRLSGVRKGGAAEKAGLQKGDVITKIGGRAITRPSDVSAAIYLRRPGESVEITAIRAGGERAVTLTLGR